ncbi:single-stranded-DNA-specific exonuclease RecJ [Candidatus Gracilibacteria bacterium]|nr:single-stranded-DNA-specific exonuclease RecJ [Candidatus Gracilibacteria bacterium]
MQEKLSILGNRIILPTHSKESSIDDILSLRFDDLSILEKNMSDLHDPYLMCDMERAVARIKLAKENYEKVIIFGDYDVDGVTSTSILMHLFKTLGMLVSYRLPHRVHDGYGLKQKFIDELAPLGVTLIITVDCGSRDADIVTYAKSLGIDIIVTDHHHVPEAMPDDAVAFLNPNRPDCPYPYKGLAGAGVALKLMMAVSREYFDDAKYLQYLQETIDIAAVGTVADCMQLTGENRIIVAEGLKQIKNSRSRGLRRLIEDKIDEDLDADIFGFLIGPRLNAAGRMDTPYKAVNLILNNSDSLETTLREIEELNNLRKQKTLEFVESALERIDSSHNIIMYHSADISHGIIGIVAGRLTERFYKPSIVLIDEGEKLVASCRAPEYFSMVEILEQFKDSFITFGGHKQAAGFSILKTDFPEFQKNIIAEMNKRDFSVHKKELTVDKSIALDEIGFKLIASMNRFKPFGMGNKKPLFIIEGYVPEKISFLGKGRDHLKFESRYGFKIFAFGLGEYYEELKKATVFDIVFDLSEDNWNGKRGIMIKIVDIVI